MCSVVFAVVQTLYFLPSPDGVIREQDFAALREAGVAGIFGPCLNVPEAANGVLQQAESMRRSRRGEIAVRFAMRSGHGIPRRRISNQAAPVRQGV